MNPTVVLFLSVSMLRCPYEEFPNMPRTQIRGFCWHYWFAPKYLNPQDVLQQESSHYALWNLKEAVYISNCSRLDRWQLCVYLADSANTVTNIIKVSEASLFKFVQHTCPARVALLPLLCDLLRLYFPIGILFQFFQCLDNGPIGFPVRYPIHSLV